ncbi:MAG: plastocyanin/azurin family copper-binding protein, partial [Crocinitomicaceae bacterium]
MNYRNILFLLTLFFYTSLSAQDVISTQGDSYVNPYANIDFTIGESVISTFSNSNISITQGFHQTWNNQNICSDPTDLIVTNITSDAADIAWSDAGISGLYNIEYGISGFVLGDGTLITGTADTTESLAGLTPNSSYEFYIQSDCGDDQSAWVGPIMFNTSLCNAIDQCDYVLNMTDDFGDGWDGQEVNFYQGGSIVSLQTLDIGFTGSASIPLCDNVITYIIASNTTNFTDEIGFNLIDLHGNTVVIWAAGNAFSAGDTLATFTTSCSEVDIAICEDPTSLSVTSITVDSADLSWTGNTGGDAVNTSYLIQTVGSSFSPNSLDINVGDTVVFVNTGGNHNVNGTTSTFVGNPESFGNSVGQGWTYTHVFQAEGTYNYQCDPHAANMFGSITVSPINNTGLANVEYGVAGFTLGSGTQIVGTSNTIESISGLSDATTYEFYVQSDCGDNQSTWIGPFDFTTQTVLPTTQLQAADCNSTLNTLADVIRADAVPGSEGYRFRLINGTDTLIVDRPFRALPLNLVSLDYLTTYNVDVAVTLNGSIGDYGTVCTIFTPGPQTKLAGQYCGYVTDNLAALVYAEIVDNASNFRFRFINGNDTLIADRPFRNIPLNSIAVEYDKTYNVDVQVTVAGATGDFGDVCTVTTTFPTTQLAPLYCGITTNNLVSQVFAMNSEGATNFRFRFINGNDT